MLDFVDAIDQFCARIFEMIFFRIEEGMDDNETIFRDRAGETAPRLLR